MNKNYMTSGEFAKLCDTSKETLRHYKNIELLIPEYEGDNGYQYYDAEQFYDYYAISLFKMTGTPLVKIKECMKHQNIPSIVKVLIQQQKDLAKEKNKLEQMEFVVKNSIFNLSIGLSSDTDEGMLQIDFFEKEDLITISQEDFYISKEDKKDENKILIELLRKYKEICTQYNMHTDYQLGAIIDPISKNIMHVYTRADKAYKNKFYKQKPAGKYLYVIQKGYWDVDIAYKNFLDYLSKNEIKTIGYIYIYDLAGFMVNGIEQNSMIIISIQVME